MKKIKYILLILLVTASSAFSQSIEPSVALLAHSYQDSVVLRWAPSNSIVWKHANNVGYTIEKIRVRLNGNLDTLSGKAPLVLATLKPWPLDDWEPIATKERLAAIAAQSLYGDSFVVSDQQGKTASIKNQIDEQHNRFSFSLMCADQSPVVAAALGLRFTDTKISKGEEYLYRVYVSDTLTNYRIDTGYVSINPEIKMELPPPDSVQIEFGDRTAILSWETLFLKRIYSNYSIERSDDGGKTYFQPNSVQFVDIDQNSGSATNLAATTYYLDSIPANYHEFFYRIRGITPFGGFGPYSSPISGQGFESGGLYVPGIRTVLVDSAIQVLWEYPTFLQEKILGYNVLRAPVLKGQFTYLTQQLLKPEDSTYMDTSPLLVNYYKVEVVTLNGTTIQSFEALGQLEDSIPPSSPKGLYGSISEDGIVLLEWDKNNEPDIYGYRVYRANNIDDEYSQVTVEALNETQFKDSINIKVLNEEIYYKVMALDNHFNPSSLSIPITLNRPDIVPPSAPVFSDIISYEDSIHLTWKASSSNDLESYFLFREYKKEFELIAELDSTSLSYTDISIEKGETYGYYLQAKDDAGLTSESTIIIVDALDDGIRASIQKFKATPDDDKNLISLSWQYPSVERFLIYKSANEESLRLTSSVGGDQFYFIDIQIEAGNIYSYAVKAIFKNGAESPLSNILKIYN